MGGTYVEEMRLALASNLIKLRTGAGITQAELGEKLNYSDKTISKWERADALPDVLVLKQISDLFQVSIDDLLNTHDKWEKPQDQESKSFLHKYSITAITMVSIAGIWTLAVLVFVILWILGRVEWTIFAYAVPVSLITYLVLHSIWRGGKHNVYIVGALVISIIGAIYIALLQYQLWQLFLVVIPAEVVVFLSFKIKRAKK
jgi:transcriptional regulator with XRE-family HTH domain